MFGPFTHVVHEEYYFNIRILKSYKIVKISGKLDFGTFYLYCLACICPHPLCIFRDIKGVNYKNQASGKL